ncbi:hypothetical protein IFM89_013346 [Coptis chinensis]|uniref:CCHC-type domain-containing protein n=1 Tax=Coptis chinensis TaxID=261450 RepID=A0A835I2V6_9MAGN|nr:hypothetical protein IFM89_013346 [Coptis chinensis]
MHSWPLCQIHLQTGSTLVQTFSIHSSTNEMFRDIKSLSFTSKDFHHNQVSMTRDLTGLSRVFLGQLSKLCSLVLTLSGIDTNCEEKENDNLMIMSVLPYRKSIQMYDLNARDPTCSQSHGDSSKGMELCELINMHREVVAKERATRANIILDATLDTPMDIYNGDADSAVDRFWQKKKLEVGQHIEDWLEIDNIEGLVLPPENTRKAGRPKKQRIRGEDEPLKTHRKCAKCGTPGHNTLTCDAREKGVHGNRIKPQDQGAQDHNEATPAAVVVTQEAPAATQAVPVAPPMQPTPDLLEPANKRAPVQAQGGRGRSRRSRGGSVPQVPQPPLIQEAPPIQDEGVRGGSRRPRGPTEGTTVRTRGFISADI